MSSYALYRIDKCYRNLKDQKAAETYLDQLVSKSESAQLIDNVNRIQASYLVDAKTYEAAVNKYLLVAQQSKTAAEATNSLFDAWEVCLHLLKDIKTSKELLEQFKSKYPKDERIRLMEVAFTSAVNDSDVTKSSRTFTRDAAALAKSNAVENAEALDSTKPVSEYALNPNYPNPFNPQTTIAYQLPQAGQVKIAVYNLLGQQIRTLVMEYQPAGRYQVQWDARNEQGKLVANGVYLYQMQVNDFVTTKKLILMK